MSNIGNKSIMAKNLAFYLEKSGKTQKEMAEIVGVAPSTFNDWMKAKNYPRIDKIEIMANYFGVLKSALIEDKLAEEKEADNDIISDIIVRLRMDKDFLSVVAKLYTFDSEKVITVNQMLGAFFK